MPISVTNKPNNANRKPFVTRFMWNQEIIHALCPSLFAPLCNLVFIGVTNKPTNANNEPFVTRYTWSQEIIHPLHRLLKHVGISP